MKSLLARFLTYYIPLVGLSVFGLLALLETQFYLDQLEELEFDLNNTADIQQPALAESLWEYDYELTLKLVNDAANMPFIDHIEVFNAHGVSVAKAGHLAEHPSEHDQLETSRELVYRKNNISERVGSLVIAAHDAAIHAEVIEDTKTNMLILGVLLLTLVLTTVLVSRRLVIKPISALQASIERLQLDQVWQPAPIDRDDEIGRTVAAYNQLQSRQIESEQALKEQHEKLDRMNVDLERRVRERTEGLEIAMQAADDANQAKSAFLANMSHEIRTPLNGVIGLLQLLERTDMNERQDAYVSKAFAASRHLLALLNDILDYSKIEADMLDLEASPFSLQTLLENLADTLGPLARDKLLELHIDSDPDCPDMLSGDVTRIAQVLINLGGNAIKFTDQGQVSIQVTTLPGANGDTVTLRFSVRDTGIGIAAERLDHIFARFTQADTGTTRRFGGTGLGLAISASLVELMNGHIEAHSQPGQGSHFWFSLPLKLADQRTAIDQAQAPDSESPTSLQGVRVLAVDDNALNQEVVTGMLDQFGVITTLADNGREAISLILEQDNPFDLVLMDMQMPVLDGIGATRELRLQHGLKQLPIIAMTANAHESDREACLAAGMDDYLAKPVAIEQLQATIQRHLNIRPSPAAPPPAPEQAAAARFPKAPGFDLSAAMRRVRNRPETYVRLARVFLETADENRANYRPLLQAPSAENAQQAAATLHKLRGGLVFLGANELAEQMQAMERRLKQDAPEQLQAELDELDRSIGEHIATLESLVDDLDRQHAEQKNAG